ncbi:MAG: ISH3 family transposase [Methanolobus sp.]|uniref:ISH3 family transposase n=1 Tax=Methanolobus sp. TaxID=1874737 RepID=UPI002730381D|nr:ISH3 family transposase [Methanolobus sp.]MDP2216701.1 ISH3 family transposase [Methanolobus sp.]
MSFLPFNSRTCDKVELRPKQCIDTVLKPLLDNINIKINGPLSSKEIFYAAICMAVDNISVHSSSKHYQEIPCETSLRYHLKKLSLEELIQVNESILLQGSLSSLKPEKKYEFAIDFTNDPYYGAIDSSNEDYVIRSQAKKSTNSFYSYVSLSIINKNERYTLAVLPVERNKTKVDYLTYFIDLIRKLNFNIKVLCLDREFYSVDVFKFLQNSEIPHITPVVRKGKQIKQLLDGRKARSAEYVMKNAQKKEVHLDIVIDVKYLKGKRSKYGCENLGFVAYGVNWPPRKISNVYRRRFAIESSYRMRNIVKPRTSTKDVTFRYFFTLISFLLRNAWLYLQKKHFTIVKPGPLTIDEDKFRFARFILFVEEWLRRKLRIQLVLQCLR